MFILYVLLAFLSGFCTDVIWALYISALADFTQYKSGAIIEKKILKQKKLKAAFFSIGTGICTLLFVAALMQGWVFSIIWLAGLGFGTYCADETENFVKQIIINNVIRKITKRFKRSKTSR